MQALLVYALLLHSLDDGFGHIVDHIVGHARIDTHPEGVVHDEIGAGQIPHHTVGIGAADLVEAGMLDQVPLNNRRVCTLWLST